MVQGEVTFIGQKNERNYGMNKVLNEELIEYIEKKIFPLYDRNEFAHGINHIKVVIRRSLELAGGL